MPVSSERNELLVVLFGLPDFSVKLPAGCRAVYANQLSQIASFFEFERAVAVLVLGADILPELIEGLLEQLSKSYPNTRTENIVLYEGVPIENFQVAVDEDRIFYLARASLSKPHLETLISAALTRYRARSRMLPNPLMMKAGLARALPDFCLRIAYQVEPSSIALILSETVSSLFGNDTVECLMYDHASDTLWIRNSSGKEERRIAAASGLVGYVAHTAQELSLSNMGDDPRYDEDADGPKTPSTSRLLALPLLSTSREVIAVLKITRSVSLQPFSSEQIAVIATYARHAAVALDHLLRREYLEETVLSNTRADVTNLSVFQKTALNYHTRPKPPGGPVLTNLPVWLEYSHLLMGTMLLLGLAFVSLARVKEKANGPMLIRARVKSTVTSKSKGLISKVLVNVGDRIREGDLIARLDGSPGDNLLDRLREECRAPTDGIVGELNVREGQEVASGDTVGTIVDETAGNEVIALLPGSYAPQIQQGMPLIFRIEGYPDSHEKVTVDNIDKEIIGPQEASRYVGAESSGSFSVSGSVIIVRAFLRGPSFASEGLMYNYHDGMTGQAEVAVRSEPMIESLIPGLKELIRHSHDEFRLH
jgi:GAF domain-containing protein